MLLQRALSNSSLPEPSVAICGILPHLQAVDGAEMGRPLFVDSWAEKADGGAMRDEAAQKTLENAVLAVFA
jgi:hypothetical protein